MNRSISRALLVILLLFAWSRPALPQTGIWRGVLLFGIAKPTDPAFFTLLRDSLHLNVFQVRTFGPPDKERVDYFLNNNKGLAVLNLDAYLAGLAADTSKYDRIKDSTLKSHARWLHRYSSNTRFYLVDEPKPERFKDFKFVSDTLRKILGHHSRAATVTMLAHGDSAIRTFVNRVQPSELMIDRYFITNNIPHPSLRGPDSVIAKAALIKVWDPEPVGNGHYLGALQQQLNNAIAEHYRPAAIAIRNTNRRLVIAPQLHGELYRATGGYDDEPGAIEEHLHLRPPSPAEIRLQYNLGLAYGARGFLAYPYGFDRGFTEESVTFPGIVAGDPSGTNHSSNFDTIYGWKNVWTGYREKWYATAQENARLSRLSTFLNSLRWNAAKSWTITTPGWIPTTHQTPHWNPGIVTRCVATVASGYHNELCLVEIGHLKKGATDVIIVVNRRSGPSDTATIRLTLSNMARWLVTDIENTSRQWRVSRGKSFSDTFLPGEGKIYTLIPF